MTLVSFIRLLLRFKWVLMTAPVLVACLVYFALRGKPDQFSSESVIYTGLVSGFNLESGGDSRLDYHVVNSGFDNLITTIQSRETLLTVSQELLGNTACGIASYPLLQNDPAVEELIGGLKSWGMSDCVEARAAVEDSLAMGTGRIYDTLLIDNGPFSIRSLTSNLSVRRISSSDLLEVRFTANDPDFAHDFLTILNNSFIERYQRIKRKEVGSVVGFFEAETARSQERLQAAVKQLQAFGTENRVINYYEQTKAIAGQKELIDQQIQQETMRLEAAESAVRDLEERIGASSEIRRRGQQLVELRQRYAELTANYAITEPTLGGSQAVDAGGTNILPTLEMQIQQSVADLYDARYSKEGLVKTELVERWLEEMVSLAQSKASLLVLQQRRAEYIKVYDEFAPLGSTLSSLEREVDVAEGEYLELLHSLNQARMRQQNIELSSSMDVLDPPSYPHEPMGSNLLMLMAAAFIVTVMLGVGAVVAVELLDESLRSPAEARKRTGMDVLGFLPEFDPANPTTNKDLDQSVKVLAARLKTIMARDPEKETHLICLASTREGDGKTTTARLLARQLGASGRSVVMVSPGQEKEDPESSENATSTYDIDGEYARASHIKDLMQLPTGQQVVILMELPAFGDNEIPVSLLKTADIVLWVARAHSLWTELEQSTLRFARDLAGIEPMMCLNAVKNERLESAMGEMNKSRSFLRRSTKRLLQRNFS